MGVGQLGYRVCFKKLKVGREFFLDHSKLLNISRKNRQNQTILTIKNFSLHPARIAFRVQRKYVVSKCIYEVRVRADNIFNVWFFRKKLKIIQTGTLKARLA